MLQGGPAPKMCGRRGIFRGTKKHSRGRKKKTFGRKYLGSWESLEKYNSARWGGGVQEKNSHSPPVRILHEIALRERTPIGNKLLHMDYSLGSVCKRLTRDISPTTPGTFLGIDQ